MFRLVVVVVCALSTLSMPLPALGALSWLYFADLQGIRAVRTNGTGFTDVLPNGFAAPIELRVDEAGSRVFFVNGAGANNWLSSTSITGGTVQNIHQATSSFINIAYNPTLDRVYGGDPGFDQIVGVNPNGSGATALVTTPNSNGFEVNDATGQVYYTERFSPRIGRVNSNGAGNTTILMTSLITGMIDAWTIDLDIAAGHMYFGGRRSSDLTNRIQRANLDGTGFTDVLSTAGVIKALRLDVPNGKMYWAEGNLIRRANLDGTGLETVFTHSTTIWGLDVTPVPAPAGVSVFLGGLLALHRRRR